MTSYTFSQRAAAALDEIYAYTLARYGAVQAERYADQLNQCFMHLAEQRVRGKKYITSDGITYHRYLCQRHYIFYYHQDADGLYIEHIIHQVRNFDEHL